MSEIRRWSAYFPTWAKEQGVVRPVMGKHKDGDYILHTDLIKIFAWMVEHRVEFMDGSIEWVDGLEWKLEEVPDGNYLAAIVRLMEVE